MDFSASSAAAQSTFLKCYDNKIKGKVAASNSAYSDSYKKAMDMFAKEGGAFFTQIEKTYKCAGLCEKGLFYVTKPVSEGRPEKSCVAAFQDKYGQNYGVAAVAFITAIVLIVAGIAAIPLCTGFSKRSEADLEKS